MAVAAIGAQAQQQHADEDGQGHARAAVAEAKHDEHEEPGHDEHEGHDESEEGLIKLSPEVLKEFGIELDTAASGTISYGTTLPGEIQINQDRLAHVVPRYPGLVLEVKKTIGDPVKKGEVLAILEGNDSLTPFPLISMIDGTVIDKHITLGESLQPDSNVYTIADMSDVWVNLTLYQKDLLLVRKGQPVAVSGGAHLPTAKGKIDYVSPTLDEHTRTGHARLVLPNPEGAWRPGMFITGNVFVGEEPVGIVIPTTAIQTLEDGASVFVETEEGFEPRPVRLGRANRTQVEIISGLTAGERYVVRGGFTLKAELGRGEMGDGHGH
jgi:cobalt-zinc-cadmium efflux system membrane fusion protein